MIKQHKSVLRNFVCAARATVSTVFLFFALAACSGGLPPKSENTPKSGVRENASGFGLSGLRLQSRTNKSVTVARGDVIVAGPDGYCVDKPGSRLIGSSAFVLLAACQSANSEKSAPAPRRAGLLTASVERRADTAIDLPALQNFINTQDGRATLARDGQASSVNILESRRESAAVFVLLADNSQGQAPGLSKTYWRGFFSLNNRLITISVYSFEQLPLSPAQELSLLLEFLNEIRRQSPKVPDENPTPKGEQPQKTVFRKIFG